MQAHRAGRAGISVDHWRSGHAESLSGTVRNYFPADGNHCRQQYPRRVVSPVLWPSRASLDRNAVLTIPAAGCVVRYRARPHRCRTAAGGNAAGNHRAALGTISGRFGTIQQLITAIGGARDQKAILDLQARISAEQGMLANDQSKLQVLYQAAQAQQWAQQQRNREQAINDIGSLRRLPAMGL